MLFIVNSWKLTGFDKCSIGFNGEGGLYEFSCLEYRANGGNSMDSGQPIKWNHKWKITRINVKSCVWALKKKKKNPNLRTEGQLMWKRPGSFNWLLSKLHVQQIDLFNFLGIYFTTSLCWEVNREEHCLRWDFCGLFVCTHTHTSRHSKQSVHFASNQFLGEGLTDKCSLVVLLKVWPVDQQS